jgi:hypothetical protein
MSNSGLRYAKFTKALRVRVAPATFASLEQQSAIAGKCVSDLAREAIDRYIAQLPRLPVVPPDTQVDR